MREKLTIGLSPCPNDTFIFHAWIEGLLDIPEGIEFEWVIEDVEQLNKRVLRDQIDASKLSFHTFAKAQKNYQLLKSGSALGFNCGPLLISHSEKLSKDPEKCKIAIPGKNTTANFLLSLAYPSITDKEELLFSEIEDAVASEEYDAGLIIHESRFTYKEKGLHKIRDLGEYWQETFEVPIPLGGIAVKRGLSDELKQLISRLMYESTMHAFENPELSKDFIHAHAQEMNPDVCQQHIDLYVNKYTKNIGKEGRRAIRIFLENQPMEVSKPIFFE